MREILEYYRILNKNQHEKNPFITEINYITNCRMKLKKKTHGFKTKCKINGITFVILTFPLLLKF